MIDVDPTALALEFLGGAVIGGCIGFATKRIAKLLAIIVGVQLMGFRYLESQGIIIVDWNRLSAGLFGSSTLNTTVESHWVTSILATLPIGVGFVSGFLIGYHRG